MTTAPSVASAEAPVAETAEARAAPRQRLQMIDVMRGLVIVIMVLDHVREFFHVNGMTGDPTDLTHTTPALFFTRWITHLCAPTFMFLAGTSAWMQEAGGKSKAELSRFLVTRGLWLIFLEVTFVGFGFNFGVSILLQVIWAFGAGFILLAGLIWLPRWLVIVVGLLIVDLHDAVTPHTPPLAILKPLWSTLLWPGPTGIAGYVTYPAIPWLGIMCLGYGLAPVFKMEAVQRRNALLLLGLGCLAGFVITRIAAPQMAPAGMPDEPIYRVLDFLNVRKYPPSPPFVLLMLGVMFLLLPLMERLRGPVASVLLAFGRVPLFTYVLHLYVAHGLAVLTGLAMGFAPGIFFNMRVDPGRAIAAGWGFGVAGVYLAWAATLVLIYPPARWFSDLKRRRKDWWLSYL